MNDRKSPAGNIPTVDAVGGPVVPPAWALVQRHLFQVMARAAHVFVQRYTRADGTLEWRSEWPGMDGSDDAYESFSSFPLFYALGGDESVHQLARRQWEAVTRQFTEYGQIHNEFDAYYDWMHHGESSLYIYYFGLADPEVARDRERALRFAGLYMGEAPDAPNWDGALRMIRSPINGSRGPRFQMTAEDWVTHRPVLANYLSPYEDVPGIDAATDPMACADWNDDTTFESILGLMNARMARGDVPLNLNATSLIANAFLYTGQDRYRQWVLDYLAAWCERTRNNGGIVPDNVGPSGDVGECMDGKWWGGYYGWRWPHGAMNLLEAALIAGANALLLTGDQTHLDLLRSQLDLLWSLGHDDDGIFTVPKRHGDCGWFDFAAPDPRYWHHLYYLSGDAGDRERLMRFPQAARENWASAGVRFGKGAQCSPQGWHAYVSGHNPDYPERIMHQALAEVNRRMELLRGDSGDPGEWDVHHWQNINPVVCEPLVQLTMGSPGVVYHGGLCHAHVRHFDFARQRPGLPPNVAALVSEAGTDHATLELVNVDPVEPAEVLMQAGAFAEHRFTAATTSCGAGVGSGGKTQVDGPYLVVRLAPAARVRLRLGMKRFVNKPTYTRPWQRHRAGICDS